MEITDVKIRRTFDSSPLKAVASVTFDGQFAVHDIKVINTENKLFIVMPSRKNSDGSFRDIAHPINSPFRSELESAVLDAYEKYDSSAQ
ncbi:MAG: septation regulator SpoVG [Clostridia bacterium]|nr:septation regulator SpoVG [Clostridia bacterium]